MAEPVIGIDLGTSYSCVATVVDGQPEVIPNEWGERTQASVVSFLDDGRVQVGNDAKRRLLTHPRRTIYSAKRLIGRYMFSPEVKKAMAVCPYEIVEGPNHGVRIKVMGEEYSLPQVSALVLKEMKEIAEAYLDVTVSKAVVTVPAYFNDNQRQATADAGRIAGLEILRIINEPTAAALAYGFGQHLHERVAIYDLGGGTFDISIMEIGEDTFEVLSTAGDTYLGGDDIDMRLMDYFADLFMQQTGLNLRSDVNALQRLREVAEETKKAFSTRKKVKVNVPEAFSDESGEVYDFQTVIDSDTFVQLTMDLVQRSFKVCDEALQSAGLTVHDLDGVILVGGPTRLPLIRDSVRHYFDKEPVAGIDPDEVVAMGAAIQASALVDSETTAFLLDITPLTLRLGTVGGYTEQIIARNTPVPIDRTRTFTTSRDNQERVKIRIYQGESNRVDENVMLGEFEFSGFRVAPRGEVQIEVTFEIDSNGILNVSAMDPETGQSASTEVSLSSGLTEAEIQASMTQVANADLI
ncbi:MAG: Hsp70 family protein [Deltaproteobacteria bacterium]|nr:Hsp70 family protein [Deltaproteobacteria bacterium]